jgi:peptidoglycan/LPS O-acetylase OafA/YrhL
MSRLAAALKHWVLSHRAPSPPLDESGVLLFAGGLLLAGLGYYYFYTSMSVMRIGGYDPVWLTAAVICWLLSIFFLGQMLREMWHITVRRLQEILDEERRLPSVPVRKNRWFNALLAFGFAAFFYLENGVINGVHWGGWFAHIINGVVTAMLILSVAMPAFLAATANWAARRESGGAKHANLR